MRLLRVIIAAALFGILQVSPAVSTGAGSLVIGIDVSGSMRGEALQKSVAAAERIVADLDGQRSLELFTFTRSISRLSSSEELATLASGGYTALYDSIWSLAQRAAELDAPLIILTDGKDSRSLIPVTELVNRFKDFPIPVNFIAYRPIPEDFTVLGEIAANSGGKVFDVDQSDQLIQVFSEAIVEVQEKSQPTESRAPIFIAIATGVITLSLLQLLRGWRRRENYLGSWSEVLDSYEVRSTRANEKLARSQKNGLLNRIVGDASLVAPKVVEKSQREFLLIATIILFVAVFLALGIPWIFSIPLGLVATLYLIKALVSRAESKARREFEDELPGSLRLIASSLTAGLSFLQALDNFSTENNSRVAREFRRALTEIQMGSPVERALGDVAERMQSEDLKWVVFAFSIQREVGGGLAKILQTSAETIDSRASLRQEIRTLSTEGRISSYILMLLPPGIFAFLVLTRREFISLFWEESIGQLLLLLVIALMGTAWIWIRRMVTLTA